MRQKQWHYVGAVLAVALLIFFLQIGGKQQHTIRLPLDSGDTDPAAVPQNDRILSIVTITPETVQDAIATLSRPSTYRYTETVSIFSGADSASAVYYIAVSGDCTRIDTTLPDGTVVHRLVCGSVSHVWYDNSATWHTLSSENVDALHRMPTYETVLGLSTSAITSAEFVTCDGRNCIAVATEQTESGYEDTYWIDTATGLLWVAQRVQNDILVYRFSVADVSTENIDQSLFLLPDGSNPADS